MEVYILTPLVSVYCLAYNHEKYIRDALEGFVSQKTNFPYEVFVHDDASTDNTAEIIREYANKYPQIIIPIIQKENQYSKGVPILRSCIYPLMKGKYIAVCEGDDYWCDDRKLQVQVDWLEDHPEYAFCVHNTKLINCLNGKERLINNCREDRDISTEEIIQWKGNLFHTSSYMFRAMYKDIPHELLIRGVGDYPKSVYFATCGKVRYIGKVMSVYRFMVTGSWSMRRYKSIDNNKVSIDHYQDRIIMLKNLDKFTEGKYTECIYDVIRRNEFNILFKKNDLRNIQKNYPEYYKNMNLKIKIRMIINYFCPTIIRLFNKFYNH